MKIKFLGTGTSTGNPEIGCQCRVCTSSDPRDFRWRTSVLLEVYGKNILLDCGPDFRMQMLQSKTSQLAAVLISHEHYDHVGGIDDLRPFCKNTKMNIYAETYVADAIKSRIPYAFKEHKYPGVPELRLNNVDPEKPFYIEDILITPIRVIHGCLPILGYRIGNFAYLTDFKVISDEEYEKLQNLDVLVMDALREKEHISHQNLQEAFVQIQKIKAKRTYLIHMSHHFGLHAEMEKQMPENVFISYDGLEIDL